MTATANRHHYRQLATYYRRLPGEFGLRPWRVFASVGTWSAGAHPGEGTRSDSEAELLEHGQPPKVVEVSAEQVALDAGLQSGDLNIGPVTPELGTPWATLAGYDVTGGQSFRIRLVNAEQGLDYQCVVVGVKRDRALHTILTVRPVRGSP